MKTINEWTLPEVSSYLKNINAFAHSNSEVVRFEKAGEGNMNFTFRAVGQDQGSLILKQAPPYCAKFPQIPAPSNRLSYEYLYYKTCQQDPLLKKYSPEMYFFENQQGVIGMQDLGVAKDFDFLYSTDEGLSPETKTFLVTYLSRLHRLPVAGLDFKNSAMRELNHAYIFDLPFRLNQDVDLEAVTPGLGAAAKVIQEDAQLRHEALALGQVYLEEGHFLIHGDYYPRSWIETPAGHFVIDPEFGHLGKREFDLGVFLAHLLLARISSGQELLKAHYLQLDECDLDLITKFCAVEVIRRIIHVTQLPLKNDLKFKVELLSWARQALKTGNSQGAL